MAAGACAAGHVAFTVSRQTEMNVNTQFTFSSVESRISAHAMVTTHSKGGSFPTNEAHLPNPAQACSKANSF